MRTKREKTKSTLLRRILTCLVSAAMIVAFTPVVAWGAETTVGDFTVSGGTLDTDYTYSNNTLTIKRSTPITISGATTTDHIVVESGVTANITLNGVNIQLLFDSNGAVGECAFEIQSKATVNLTLQNGNKLVSGGKKAGLHVPSESTLTIIGASTGSLSATGRGNAAGIGGGHEGGDSGTITIEGGTVEAIANGRGAGIGGGGSGGLIGGSGGIVTITGGAVTAISKSNGAGIGGGGANSVGTGGPGGTVIITGGEVTATSFRGAGIGGGRQSDSGAINSDSSFSTTNNGSPGNAVIFAKSIIDKSKQDSWSGVVFEGASYDATNGVTFESVDPATFGISQSSGENPTAMVSIDGISTLSDGHSITIGSNAAVRVANLDNNGSIMNNGKIYVDGSLTGTAPANGTNGAVYYPLTLDADGGTISGGSGIAEINGNKYYNSTSGTTLPILTKNGYTFAGWTGTNQSTPSTSVTIPNGSTGNKSYTANWTVNQYTIAFESNGGTSFEPIKQDYNTAVNLPTPTKNGYSFGGWYSDSDLSTQYTESTMPAKNIKLYAKWLSQDASVKTVTVKGVGATVDNASRTVEVTLPYNVALPTQDSDFVIEPAQGAKVTTPPVKESDVWKFTVTAEDGKTKAIYTISVNIQKENIQKENVQKENVQKENVWKETVLRLQSTASKTSIKLKWNAVPEADGYVIYWSKCGSKNSFKQVKVIENGKTLTWTHKNLKKGSWNRYYVKVYKVIDGKKSFIKTSNKIHLTTKGGKYTNVKKLKASISSVTLKKGKTKALKIKQTYAEKNKKPTLHMRPLIYTTSDKTVATVTKKGVIKAKGTGSCYIYITAYSGVYTRVKVTVK